MFDAPVASDKPPTLPRTPLPFLEQVTKLPTDYLPDGVNVWQVTLTAEIDQSAQDEQPLYPLLLQLNAEERHRCLRYRRPVDRIRFAVMRIVLRELLAQHVQQAAQSLQFVHGPFGKPGLAQAGTTLQFNISHSEHIGLIALSTQRAIGVDVEAVYPLRNQQFLLKDILSLEEQRYCVQSQQDSAFFQCWTGKEAILKALGTGIQQPLSSISILPTATCAYTVSLRDQLPTLQVWQLPVADGYTAALALL
ncbi:4'-phosphopantetheinyl transferase superfamily protein [Methylophilus sp. OH31]|uniref:4'-phosphopantetheinyl transferase family protein n=1 Tax=Methylophilus sp. OH31 TaxID=1387312 RepID=UPI00046533E2|nr:4'-phosphopantetheinyl transferase superfamily protein [Methylophilus sp. OH31]